MYNGTVSIWIIQDNKSLDFLYKCSLFSNVGNCATVIHEILIPFSFNFQLSSHILHVSKNLNSKHRVPGQSCSHSDLGTVPWTSGIHFYTPCPWLRCMEAGQTYPLQAKQKHSLLTKWNMHSMLFAMSSSIQHEMQYSCILTIYARKILFE